jgi:PKD repeat protein
MVPLTVDFTNLSTGDYDNCSWTFGDGENSSSCNDASHEYADAGVYTVSLAVSGLGGDDVETKTAYISVYEPVAADFDGDPTSGPDPLTVDFSNLSTGSYDTCLWDFGDDGTSNECSDPSHQYTTDGLYTVSLTVSGPGGTDMITQDDYITVYAAAHADFDGSPTSGLMPLTVDFSNLSTGDFDTCSWTFGDGESSSSCNDPSHEYTGPGIYTVSLTVSGLGGDDTETREGYVSVWQSTIHLPVVLRRN